MDFNFKQPFYKESELLKIIPIKRSTFYSWQSEWIANGNDPREMGKILILSNPKSKKPLVYWDAKKFLNWVYKYKVNTDPQFDYEYHSKAVAVALIKGAKENGN